MKLAYYYSHHYGKQEWEERELFDWVCSIINEPLINVKQSTSKNLQEYFRFQLTSKGWSDSVKISVDSNLTIFSLYSDLALQLQTGNVSRYAYDLLKIEYLYQSGKINAAALLLPTKDAAKNIGDNVANADRAWNELCIFNRVISVPILVLAFE